MRMIETLSDDQVTQLLDLYQQGWWSSKRDLKDCQKILNNSSFIVGLINENEELIAFARVLTDYYQFSYVYDVLVDKQHRGLGLGKKIIQAIINHPKLKGVENIELVCPKNMIAFYEQFGFSDDYGQSKSLRLVRT